MHAVGEYLVVCHIWHPVGYSGGPLPGMTLSAHAREAGTDLYLMFSYIEVELYYWGTFNE